MLKMFTTFADSWERDVYTLCLKKNDTDVAHYNLDVDQPILIIFGV